MARMAPLLIALVLFQDDGEIARWIDDLGHEELARREAAQARLLKCGAKALPALKKALESEDPEKIARVLKITGEIERLGREKEHDARERLLNLELVTVGFAEGELSDVLAAVARQLRIKFDSSVEGPKPVRVPETELPLQQLLDSLELQLDIKFIRDAKSGRTFKVSDGRYLHPPRHYLRGTTLEFTTKEYRVDGKLQGWRLEARNVGPAWAGIESAEIKGPDGSARQIELCGECGPGLIFIRGDKPEELRVRLRGGVLWSSRYELNVANPEVAQTFRVGSYQVHYEFPRVRITTSTPTDSSLFASGDLEGTWKADSDRDTMGFGGRFAKVGGTPKGWCKCKEGPTPVVPVGPRLITEDVTSKWSYEKVLPSAFKSMKVIVKKRFMEPFDGETVVPVD
jgi:hypothetical protein